MYIFISHSSADAQVATEICSLIEQNNANCFIAPRDIRSGMEYAEEIINGIQQADAMVVVMSEKANHSPHVLREVERAVSRSIPILVYKLEEVELTKSMEYFLMAHQWVTSKQKRDYSEILSFIDAYNNTEPKEDSATKQPSSKTFLFDKKKTFIFLIVAITTLLLLCSALLFFKEPGPEFKVGDTVTFGTYNGEKISWRILKISDNEKEAVLITSNIITMKPYDVAEGGMFNSDSNDSYWTSDTLADTDLELQIQVRGNNTWETSNIRTWLNSSDEVVTYSDYPPISQATSEHYNGYHNEPGFLYSFTEEEKALIIISQVSTPGNELANNTNIITNDKVFLLSSDELQWFYQAGMSPLAVPTALSLEQDNSDWYDIQLAEYKIDTYYWWLREPVDGTTSQCYMVNNGYSQEDKITANVGVEGFGIRPAITVDLSSKYFSEQY